MTLSSKPFRFAVQSYSATDAADWRAQARAAESLGYSAFYLADHIIGPGPALTPTNHPVQNLAAVPAVCLAAEATTTIRVGCRVFACDYRNPVMFAKELATLDLFSGGRLDIGLGAGWLQNEYEAIGVSFLSAGQRIDRLEETIALLRVSFVDGEVNQHGEHVHAVGFEAVPKPVQRPCPPIMIGGGSKRVLGIAGREADIVSLNFDNSSGRIGPEGVGSGTAEGTQQKIDFIRAGAGDRFDAIELEIGAYFTVVTDKRDATVAGMSAAMGLTPEQLADHPHALIGSVDAICEALVARRERYGISYVTVGRAAMESFAPVVEQLGGR
jgi:probable F420-dependent oxidoreductase